MHAMRKVHIFIKFYISQFHNIYRKKIRKKDVEFDKESILSLTLVKYENPYSNYYKRYQQTNFSFISYQHSNN